MIQKFNFYNNDQEILHVCTNISIKLPEHLHLRISSFTLISQDNLGKPVPERKTGLDLNEARDDGMFGCSGICWNICKQSAPCSRQTDCLHMVQLMVLPFWYQLAKAVEEKRPLNGWSSSSSCIS